MLAGIVKSTAFWFFFLPYAAGQSAGAWVTLGICAAALVAGFLLEKPDNRVWTKIRPLCIALSLYGCASLAALILFNGSLREFERWYRKGAGLLPGMTQSEAERALAQRCRFVSETEGQLLIYRLTPGGLARFHPLRGFASLELYVVQARMDPVTSLLIESSVLGQ